MRAIATIPWSSTLASAGGGGGVVVWALALAGLAVVFVAALMALRRRMLARGEDAGAPLTLADLRAMHAEGRLTDAEYGAAREAALRQVGAKPGRGRSVSGAGAGPGPGLGARPVDGERRARPGFDLTGDPLPGGPGSDAGPV